MTKIYILGAVGSGKSTLAKKISYELNIPYYELDNIIWKKNDEGPDSKRAKKEITTIFNEIIKQENWIIENVGKNIFDKGLEYADKIIYLNFKKRILYYRVLKRWIKQNLKIEKAPYKTNLKMLIQMFKWVDKEKTNSKLSKLTKYMNKVTILDHKSLKKYKFY